MISDEKRREVAAKLRAEAESWRYYREDDSAFCMNDYEFTEAVLEDFGFDDMDMPAYEVFDQIADLMLVGDALHRVRQGVRAHEASLLVALLPELQRGQGCVTDAEFDRAVMVTVASAMAMWLSGALEKVEVI